MATVAVDSMRCYAWPRVRRDSSPPTAIATPIVATIRLAALSRPHRAYVETVAAISTSSVGHDSWTKPTSAQIARLLRRVDRQ